MQPMMRRLQILIRLLYSAPHSKVLISKSLRVYLYCGVCVKTSEREREGPPSFKTCEKDNKAAEIKDR